MSGKAEVLGFLQAFKVNLGIWGVICISFHIAELKMKYPFK
jgi:hypothetical protein